MFILVDKPKAVTSHDVVDKVRKITGEKKVGHAGTLDPNATGLLIIGVGRTSTKKLGVIARKTRKTYLAYIYLGEERDTDDVEGKVIKRAENYSYPSGRIIQSVLGSFIGKQNQTPPAYSALKLKGKKAYELARKGIDFKLKPRIIEIFSIKVIKYKYPTLNIEVVVSSGTYIRSLARDIGRKLGCGAYLKNLRRKKIGRFSVKDAVKLTNLTKENWENFVVEIK
jgi:tRNA pseudouridine55 synthase